MTVHNRRCDCCGDRLPLVPSEIHPGEQYIAGGGLGVGATAAPAGRPLTTPPGRGGPRRGPALPTALPGLVGRAPPDAHAGART